MHTRRRALGFLSGAPLAACVTQQRSGEERGRIAVDGADIAYRRRFGRNPTIVFESGLGDGLESWDGMFAEIAAEHAVFAYSRPGYGESTVLPNAGGVRTATQSAQLLDAVLAAARVCPPYVLVGHSLGGMYIAQYAALYPRKVRALVFDDGRPPGFRARCQREGVEYCARVTPRPDDWPAHLRAEAEGILDAEANPPPMSAIANIPTTVIVGTVGQQSPEGQRAREVWLAEQQDYARGFRDGRYVVAQGAGHYVHHDQPELVAREIELRASA